MSFIQPIDQPKRVIFNDAIVFSPAGMPASIAMLGQSSASPLILNRDELSKPSLEAAIEYYQTHRVPVFAKFMRYQWERSIDNIALEMMFNAYNGTDENFNTFQGCSTIQDLLSKYNKSGDISKVIFTKLDEEESGFCSGFKDHFRMKIELSAKPFYLRKIEKTFLSGDLLNAAFMDKFVALRTDQDREDLVKRPYESFYKYVLSNAGGYLKTLENNGIIETDKSNERQKFEASFATLSKQRQVIIESMSCEHMMLELNALNTIFRHPGGSAFKAVHHQNLARLAFSEHNVDMFREEYCHAVDDLLDFSEQHKKRLLAMPAAGNTLITAAAIKRDSRHTPDRYAEGQEVEVLAAIEHVMADLAEAGKTPEAIAEIMSKAMPKPWAAYQLFAELEKERAVIEMYRRRGGDAAEALADEINPKKSANDIVEAAKRDGTLGKKTRGV